MVLIVFSSGFLSGALWSFCEKQSRGPFSDEGGLSMAISYAC